MKCTICGTMIGSIDEAIAHDWIFLFYEGDEPYGPACADCAVSLLQMGEDGEMEVKEEYRGKIVYLVKADDPDDELADTADYLLMAISFN
jgi:hypothetical protein